MTSRSSGWPVVVIRYSGPLYRREWVSKTARYRPRWVRTWFPVSTASIGKTPRSVEMGTPAGRQIPQAMQVSSEMAARPVSSLSQMTSVPVRMGGQ